MLVWPVQSMRTPGECRVLEYFCEVDICAMGESMPPDVNASICAIIHNHRKIIYFVCVRHANFQNRGCRHGSFLRSIEIKTDRNTSQTKHKRQVVWASSGNPHAFGQLPKVLRTTGQSEPLFGPRILACARWRTDWPPYRSVEPGVLPSE